MTSIKQPSLASFADNVPFMSDAPLFQKERHIQYWLRCLRSPLPHHYTSMDASRLTLAYFTVAALDLLGILFTRTTIQERNDYIDWIYSCQHTRGGFKMYPSKGSQLENGAWDPATLPATYFALAALTTLGDDLKRIRRKETLQFLNRLQRPGGSFGEFLSPEGDIMGGMDTRYGYCATCVRWFLRGDAIGPVEDVPDIDVDELERCIRESQSFDGGISEEPSHEAHAGFTYCALSALSITNRIDVSSTTSKQSCDQSSEQSRKDEQFTASVRHWLMSLLTPDLEERDDDDDDDMAETDLSSEPDVASTPDTSISETSYTSTSALPPPKDPNAKLENSSIDHSLNATEPLISDEPCVGLPSLYHIPTARWTGFSGRPNKIADTCYVWWVGASLKQLDSLRFVEGAPLRRYLLAKVQHMVAGGFGKMPGDPPDLYHSYLGLAALSVMGVGEGEEAVLGPNVEDAARDEVEQYAGLDVANKLDHEEGVLRKVDPVLCMSVRAREWRKRVGWD